MITNRFGRQRFRTGDEFWFLSELGDVMIWGRSPGRRQLGRSRSKEDFARFSSLLCRILWRRKFHRNIWL